MKNDRAIELVSHMRDAATEACSFVEGFDKQKFLTDTRTQRAVVYSILIVGGLQQK